MEQNVIEKIKIMLDPGSYVPDRAHEADAGYDIRSVEGKIVPAKGSAVFDTGVHMAIPRGYVGFLKSKSGLNVKNGITSEGVIDSGYTGSIVVKLYNSSDADYMVHSGDKISQLVILPIITPGLELVAGLDDTDRGTGGFGGQRTMNNSYWERIEAIANRQREKGIETYGQGIEANPADIHTRIEMALEELVDLAMYLCWVEDTWNQF